MLPMEMKRQTQKSTDALQEKSTECVSQSERGRGGGGSECQFKRGEVALKPVRPD